MTDLFLGQTCTEAFTFQSAAAAHTFEFGFQPDKVVFNNITAWVATAGKIPVSVWFRTLTDSADAQQMVTIDSAAGASFNFKTETTNGFTVANTAGGVDSYHATISAISQADPCSITHSAYTFQTNQVIRITDLGSDMPTARGMNQLNFNRYRIVVTGATTFTLKDVITGEPIDSTAYTAYVTGGRITLESAVLTLNNPQVTPYSSSNPYLPNPYAYNSVTYQLTVGTAVLGTDNDLFFVEAYKFGSFTQLGDLA